MTPLPTCIEESCSHVPFLNVNLTLSDCNGTASQSTCTIVCDEGYSTTQNYTTCVRGGWVGNVSCVPNPCTNDLPLISQLNVSASTTTCNNTASGSSCEITCESGFTPSSSLECSLGSWVESTIPTCDMDCSGNPPIQFLNETATLCQNTASGSTCSGATCLRSLSAYYTLDSQVSLICYNGTYVVRDSTSQTTDISALVKVETYESTNSLICSPDACDSEPVILNYTGSGCAGTSLSYPYH